MTGAHRQNAPSFSHWSHSLPATWPFIDQAAGLRGQAGPGGRKGSQTGTGPEGCTLSLKTPGQGGQVSCGHLESTPSSQLTSLFQVHLYTTSWWSIWLAITCRAHPEVWSRATIHLTAKPFNWSAFDQPCPSNMQQDRFREDGILQNMDTVFITCHRFMLSACSDWWPSNTNLSVSQLQFWMIVNVSVT